MLEKIGIRGILKLIIVGLVVLCVALIFATGNTFGATKPSQVKGLKGTVHSTTRVVLSWSKVSGASGYSVYRKASTASTYSKVKSVTTTSYGDVAKANTTYKYYVKAYKKSGSSKIYGKASTSVTLTTEAYPATVAESVFKTYMDSDGFCIKDGILYAYYGTATTITIPSTVTEIYPDAFSGDLADGRAQKVETIVVPGTVKKIDCKAFEFCNADYYYIREGVEQIGDRAFSDTYFKEIYYPSTLKKIGWQINESEEGNGSSSKIFCKKNSAIYKYLKKYAPYGNPAVLAY